MNTIGSYVGVGINGDDLPSRHGQGTSKETLDSNCENHRR